MNARDYTSDGVHFEFLSSPLLSAFHPTSGHSSSPLRVLASGRFFSLRASRLSLAVCALNRSIASAFVITPQLLTCTLFPGKPGTAVFRVANTAPAVSASALQLLILPPSLVRISPQVGPIGGGTIITFSGGPFHPSFHAGSFCQIGEQMSPLTFLSSSTLSCVTHRETAPGTSLVTLHFDVAQMATGFSFTHHARPRIESIKPRLGPVKGGTVVMLLGHGFEPMHHTQCYFGEARSGARFISANRLICISPARTAAGLLLVRVTIDSSLAVAQQHVFAVEPELELVSIRPTVGPPNGGTPVRAHGSNFSSRAWQVGLLACRFNQTDVVALLLSGNAMECFSPAHDFGLVAFELTSNQQQYTRVGLLFKFVLTALGAIRPSAGPVRGGSRVSLRLTGHAPLSPARLLCHFGLNNTVSCVHLRSSALIIVTLSSTPPPLPPTHQPHHLAPA